MRGNGAPKRGAARGNRASEGSKRSARGDPASKTVAHGTVRGGLANAQEGVAQVTPAAPNERVEHSDDRVGICSSEGEQNGVARLQVHLDTTVRQGREACRETRNMLK